MLVERLEPHRDARGFVVEPLDAPGLSRQRNVHVVWTAPGAVRGNHYHVRGTEVSLVVGPAFVRYRDAEGTRDVRVPSGALYRFTIPPGTAHAYGATGPEPMLIVGFNSELHDRAIPDAVSVKLLDSSELKA